MTVTIPVIRERYPDPVHAFNEFQIPFVRAIYDVIIGDDYNSPSNTSNADQRKKVIDHYQYNQSILEPGGTYLIVGTRYHEEDLIGWLIKNELGFETLEKFKAIPKDKGVRYF